MNQNEFEAILADPTKLISGDIGWSEDKKHPPTVIFSIEVTSQIGYTLSIKGSYNPAAQRLTYALIHPDFGRIYGLDMGKNHRNPSGNKVGRKHKHRWIEQLGDQEAYVPEDIVAPVTDPVTVWQQFCSESFIRHDGVMHSPPTLQLERS